MHALLQTIASRVAALKDGTAAFFRGAGWDCSPVKSIREELVDYPEGRERNRRLIIFFAVLFIFDYVAYSYHTDTNLFAIFPSIPSTGSQRTASIYFPSLDGTTIVEEKRTIPCFDDEEKTAQCLFETVVEGRRYANTAAAVPAELLLRKVWIRRGAKGAGGVCVFDIEPVEIASDADVIKNSEALFRQALEKTVKKNMPGMETVLVLEKGAASRLWEF
ncbi:MAG: hypothetical protein JW838_01755 [Spirochaetes bacterium]|nr:hypothetical protein [Spirochaetota bacterium]